MHLELLQSKRNPTSLVLRCEITSAGNGCRSPASLLAGGHRHSAPPALFPAAGWEEGTWRGFAVPYLPYLSEVFYWEDCFLNPRSHLAYLIIIK